MLRPPTRKVFVLVISRIGTVPTTESGASYQARHAAAALGEACASVTTAARSAAGELLEKFPIFTVPQHLPFSLELVGIGKLHPQAGRVEYGLEASHEHWMRSARAQAA